MNPLKDVFVNGLAFVLVSGGVFAQNAAPSATSPAPSAAPLATSTTAPLPATAFPELRNQQEKLTLENGIEEQKLKKSLAALTAEKQRLELENGIAQQKLQGEIASLGAEIEKLTRQADLASKRLALKQAESKEKLEADLAVLRDTIEKQRVAGDLASLDAAAKLRDIQQHDAEVSLKLKQLQLDRTDFELQVAKLSSQLDLREKRDQWKNRVNHDIVYTKEPYKDGVLTISDRRIALNDVILMDTADYVAERIDYFNNQDSENPIFIVIDSSPGGSVMAGYKILKAMEGSPAPVYVVVKSFAASMAAGIATLAKQSFAYPNAIILHHQMLAGIFGNLTEEKEALAEQENWWKRLATPVAAKMGVTLDEFIKQMYQHRSTGDWREFGDAAQKLKWVDLIVDRIREESFIKAPDGGDDTPRQPRFPLNEEKVDSNGRHYVALPRLNPADCYYLYNPDNYYRITQ